MYNVNLKLSGWRARHWIAMKQPFCLFAVNEPHAGALANQVNTILGITTSASTNNLPIPAQEKQYL